MGCNVLGWRFSNFSILRITRGIVRANSWVLLPGVSASACLGWSQRICISNGFPVKLLPGLGTTCLDHVFPQCPKVAGSVDWTLWVEEISMEGAHCPSLYPSPAVTGPSALNTLTATPPQGLPFLLFFVAKIKTRLKCLARGPRRPRQLEYPAGTFKGIMILTDHTQRFRYTRDLLTLKIKNVVNTHFFGMVNRLLRQTDRIISNYRKKNSAVSKQDCLRPWGCAFSVSKLVLVAARGPRRRKFQNFQ